MTGSLQENVASVERSVLMQSTSEAIARLHGVLGVANHLIHICPFVPTQTAKQIYEESKQQYLGKEILQPPAKRKSMSVEVLELLGKHINVMQIYVCGKGFITCGQHDENVQNFVNYLDDLQDQPKIISE